MGASVTANNDSSCNITMCLPNIKEEKAQEEEEEQMLVWQ